MTALPPLEHPREPRPGRRDRALDAGYHPTADDNAPLAEHLRLAGDDEWMVAIRRSSEYLAAFGRCSHPHCRTSLTDESVTYCPHDQPFCEACVWEDGCDECSRLSGEIA